MVVSLIERIYALLWGDLIHVPLPGGDSVGISLLIILLIPTGIYFTVRTKVLPLRLFPDMTRALMSKKENKDSPVSYTHLDVYKRQMRYRTPVFRLRDREYLWQS